MLENYVKKLGGHPVLTRAVEGALAGYFIVSPLAMILSDKTHKTLTPKEISAMGESTWISVTEVFSVPFLPWALAFTALTGVIAGLVSYLGNRALIAEKKKTEELKELLDKHKELQKALERSEGRFRDISYSMADWIWELDENGVFTFVAGNIEKILGYKPEEILGKTPFDLMEEDEARRVGGIFHGVAAEKRPIKDLESWNLSKSGERVLLRTNGVPMVDDNGELRGYRGVDKDITEMKLAERKAEEDKTKFKNIFQESSTGMYRTRADGSVIAANRAFAEIFGYSSAEEIMNINVADLYAYPKDRDQFLRAIAENKSWTEKMKIRKKDGEVSSLECFAVGAFSKSGDLEYITGTVIARETHEGIIPLCSYCHNVRAQDGKWVSLSSGLYGYGVKSLSHGICPECATELHKQLEEG